MSEDVIEFVASVAQIKTMADGGLRFVFDAPETAVMQAAQLMECKRFGAALEITAIIRVVDDERRTDKNRKIHI